MTDSLIQLRVPAATKARWVRESRAAGMRLTDWIVERVEIRALLAERDALREALQGLLDALPSATTHPAIQAARAALAQGEV